MSAELVAQHKVILEDLATLQQAMVEKKQQELDFCAAHPEAVAEISCLNVNELKARLERFRYEVDGRYTA